MHLGIDVSSNQSSVDFERVAGAGYRFAYVKATEGVGFQDPRCLGRHHEARDAGLHAGFYHFLRPRPGRSGAREAEWFWSVVQGVRGGENGAELLRLVVDVEVTDFEGPDRDALTREYTRDCLARLTDLADHQPMVYTFPAFLSYWGQELAGYPLWIAHYDVEHPRVPEPFPSWAAWQFTSHGRPPGVAGDCDENKCPELAGLILERNQY